MAVEDVPLSVAFHLAGKRLVGGTRVKTADRAAERDGK